MQIERNDNFIASLSVEAYRVGGSVRDEILGRAPKDADYVVRGIELDDLADLIQAQGRDLTVSIIRDRRNQAFGVRAASRKRGVNVEIALPRREENAGAGRAQTIVASPGITLDEDARRRDFTFNALYLPVGGSGVIDPTGRGLHDLQRGMIQTTHPFSFRDDPLRMLRGLRFMARGFTLTGQTLKEMDYWAEAVDGLTANGFTSGTVVDEMNKILMGDGCADALRVARDTGVLARLFPELAPMIGFEQQSRYHDLTTDEHTFSALETAVRVDAPLRVRWALLFHDAGKPASAWMGDDGRLHFYEKGDKRDHAVESDALWLKMCNRVPITREMRRDVSVLIRNHMVNLSGRFKASKVRRDRIEFGDGILHDLYLHRACDVMGKGKPDKDALARLVAMETERVKAQQDGVPATVRELAINGHTLQAMGIQGEEIGRVLRLLLDEVACQPSETTMDPTWQMERACSIASEGKVTRAVNNRG